MPRPDLEEAIGRIQDLPTLPAVLGQILDATIDPDSSALDVSEYIVTDQSLSARLLKLVNSSYYGFYRQIASVTDAVVILGFDEIRTMVLTATAFGALEEGGSGYDRIQLWRHAMAAGWAAQTIAKRKRMDTGDAFVCGLLHDIGKVVLDVIYPEQFYRTVQQAHGEERFLREVEQEAFGMDHAYVGGLLAEHWNFPENAVCSIRYHHTVEAAPPTAVDLCRITAMADYITYLADLGENGNGREALFPQPLATVVGLDHAACQQMAVDLEGRREQIDDFVGALS